MKPFIKWAGGKRWLIDCPDFSIPEFEGRYIEPFLGGGAVFFHLQPKASILSDLNPRLIEVYQAVRDDWKRVENELRKLQKLHSKAYYYEERSRRRLRKHTKAAQFLYLNRTCWNGLYRENLSGVFNVPIGSKTRVLLPDDDFEGVSRLLKKAEIYSGDFEDTLLEAKSGDFVFVDPPYTTAHNLNGFVKYNQNIFSWDDQVRLKSSIQAAIARGATVALTNADHKSIWDLYSDMEEPVIVSRASVISGDAAKRGKTTEVLYIFGGNQLNVRSAEEGSEEHPPRFRAAEL